MTRRFLDYLRDEEGQTSVEYILLMAVVVLIVLKFKKSAQGMLDGLMSTVEEKTKGAIENEFKAL